jgi:hypothetical protein
MAENKYKAMKLKWGDRHVEFEHFQYDEEYWLWEATIGDMVVLMEEIDEVDARENDMTNVAYHQWNGASCHEVAPWHGDTAQEALDMLRQGLKSRIAEYRRTLVGKKKDETRK